MDPYAHLGVYCRPGLLLSNFEEIVVFGKINFEETVVFGEKNFEETEFFEWKVLIINKMCPVALPDFFT
ncbi:MAG: hypothetical protein II637_01180, partial [Bacteroidales bacterium]|nr:hypothetical protein [Bacteroidales bacterium]